ncbi:OmpP1/FadL family transporter [Vibrio crassostreae]|uniref:OmpP1/FadL family transporter n=1 Tax=Vibrio crassostreae TaxID=246167 RepID=UPI001B310089|nr:outer membrane protein transport protein [Vibrio crassostreae]
MKPTKLTLACFAALTSTSALASGHLMSDLGALNASTAGAGSAALAETALTAWSNPAGMANLESDNFTMNVAALGLDVNYSDIGSTMNGEDADNAGSWMPIASMYYTTQLNDKFTFGVSLASQGGSGLDYGEDFRGSPATETVDLVTVQLAPALSYKVDDKLSIGATLNIEHASIKQTMSDFVDNGTGNHVSTRANVSTKDLTLGYTLSALYNVDENNRFGLVYRSEIDHTAEGSAHLDGNIAHGVNASIGLVMPRQATFSGYHKRDKLAYLYTLGWTDFSVLDKTPIEVANTTGDIVRNFQDTWNASVGMHYEMSQNLRFEGGLGFESSPVTDSQFQNPDLPAGELWRLGFGANHDLGSNWSAKYYYEYLRWSKEVIDRDYNPIGTLHGEYDSFAHYFGVQINKSF